MTESRRFIYHAVPFMAAVALGFGLAVAHASFWVGSLAVVLLVFFGLWWRFLR